MVSKGRFGAIAVALGLMLGVPGVVQAQDQVPQAQPPVEVTDELLEQFVEVYPEIEEAVQQAQMQMGTAETAEEAQSIQRTTQEQITTILEDADLSVREYEAVVTRLNDDPELRAEMEQMLLEQEETGGGV